MVSGGVLRAVSCSVSVCFVALSDLRRLLVVLLMAGALLFRVRGGVMELGVKQRA